MLLVAGIEPSKRIRLSSAQRKLRGISLLNVPKSLVPGVTHVDYSARIQTVHETTNPVYFKLIERFFNSTGCPVLVNTSFNVRGEPIVESPEDAYRCFMGTDLDVLVVGRAFLEKKNQVSSFPENYQNRYHLD
jgi:carbamoyltransferase